MYKKSTFLKRSTKKQELTCRYGQFFLRNGDAAETAGLSDLFQVAEFSQHSILLVEMIKGRGMVKENQSRSRTIFVSKYQERNEMLATPIIEKCVACETLEENILQLQSRQ